MNIDTFKVIFAYQIKKQNKILEEKIDSDKLECDYKKQEISDIDSNDKMIVCIINKTKVYRIIKKTDN